VKSQSAAGETMAADTASDHDLLFLRLNDVSTGDTCNAPAFYLFSGKLTTLNDDLKVVDITGARMEMCNRPEQELVDSGTALAVSWIPVIGQMMATAEIFQNCSATNTQSVAAKTLMKAPRVTDLCT